MASFVALRLGPELELGWKRLGERGSSFSALELVRREKRQGEREEKEGG